MSFDYSADDVDDEKVRAVASEMAGGGLKPISPEEIAQREIEWEIRREESRARQREMDAAHEAERLARAEQEQAEWLSEHRKQEAIRQRERSEHFTRELHQRELRDMRFQITQAKAWQRNVDDFANRAVRQQYRQTLVGELDAMINPPQPEPEPEPQIIMVSDEGSPELGSPDFDVRVFNKKSRRWW
jgi:hypothetical protein